MECFSSHRKKTKNVKTLPKKNYFIVSTCVSECESELALGPLLQIEIKAHLEL